MIIISNRVLLTLTSTGICVLISFCASAAIQLSDKFLEGKASDGKVEFLAVGRPSAIKIRGKAEGPQGKISISQNKVSGRWTLDLQKLNTGISLRDEHMKEKYLQVFQFPQAVFTFEKLDLNSIVEGQESEVQGKLALHGKESDVKAAVTITKKSATELFVKAKFPVDIDKHQIEIPKYMGITVAQEIQIEVESQLIAVQ